MFAFIRRSRQRSWIFAISILLAGCVAPALLLSPQGQLMWALLKPLVGLDPNEMNLLEQPLIKNRMQPLLGEHYDTAVTLLKTADKLQQEGPLFYLVSNHTPIPQLAEKAGFVWNSETNQMAVMLVSGGAPQIFAEQLNNQAAKVVPSWPADLADYADPVKLKQKALQKASSEASAQLGLSVQQQQLAGAVLGGARVEDVAKAQLEQQKQQLINTATEPVAAKVNAVKQQVNVVKTQVKAATDVQAAVKTSLETNVKTQLQQAVQPALEVETQVKEQAQSQLETLAEPVTTLKTEAKAAVNAPVQTAAQQGQQLKTQVQAQLKDEAQAQTKTLTEPVTDMNTQLNTAVDTNVKTAVQSVNSLEAAPATGNADDNDLAAEMAAEQASLLQSTQQTAVADKAARLDAVNAAVAKAQAEVQTAATLLSQANSPAEVAAAKAKLDAASKTLAQAKALQQQLSQP
ncbi:hypothetical protein [Rheinheimera sp. 4Y26]|uniref:hypothetical protein n=1 Tax=Rheinheimera sp. 4Y26 TaxID=2977811 RepID=UPI0021B0CC05|nr:hypothetical protein [Rheinheimera sp. 4Y26]MCT6699467.1 hypothetical protein [Rheinheimera sp. 4Y26]